MQKIITKYRHVCVCVYHCVVRRSQVLNLMSKKRFNRNEKLSVVLSREIVGRVLVKMLSMVGGVERKCNSREYDPAGDRSYQD